MADAFDLAVLGSGFGGSLLAMVGRRLGLRVLLLERGSHPRFAMGESSSPLANLLLEELALRYDLPRLLPLTSYGSWKRSYPELTVGLKRGFTFYPQPAAAKDGAAGRGLLVAASPSDEVADTHWYRRDFDQFLMSEVQALGAEYVDRVDVERTTPVGDGWLLEGTREGRSVAYRARFVVDATGPRGVLSRLLGLSEASFRSYPATQALFSHFTGVQRVGDATSGNPPYPPDDAALHHLFDGGWMWVLRFENGITSAGIAVDDWLADELRLADGAAAWTRFLERFPSIQAQFAESEAVLPFFHSARLSYRCSIAAGPNWALLPSAAAFVDPLFSTGFPLTLLGIHRLGRLLEEMRDEDSLEARLREYDALTLREADTAAMLVGACYRSFHDLSGFSALSMLYFVAASYSEMARRLRRPHLASEFLLGNRQPFRAAFDRHCSAANAGRPPSLEDVGADVEPFNIAGLCDPGKRGWYGVDLEDVVRGADKLQATPQEVRDFFTRMGW